MIIVGSWEGPDYRIDGARRGQSRAGPWLRGGFAAAPVAFQTLCVPASARSRCGTAFMHACWALGPFIDGGKHRVDPLKDEVPDGSLKIIDFGSDWLHFGHGLKNIFTL